MRIGKFVDALVYYVVVTLIVGIVAGAIILSILAGLGFRWGCVGA